MKKTQFKTGWRIFILLSLPLQYLIIQYLKRQPQWVEEHYTLSFYQSYSSLFHQVFGWIPLSIGDVSYAILVLILLNKIRLIIIKKSRLKYFFQLTALVSVVYFMFHLSWGLNYYRIPIHQQLDIKQAYSTNELLSFTEFLIDRTNDIHSNLSENDSLAISFDDSTEEFELMTFESLHDKGFKNQNVKNLSLKPSLFSLPLSYMGFGGYLNPLTLEAQYNYKVPHYKYPTLLSHEMAHQLGYAKENEANFVACFVTMNHENEKIRYAGFTYALKFCLNDVYRRSPNDFERLKSKVNPGILENYKEVQVFWESYNNPLEPLFKDFYGGFLKVNNQPQGIESYNYVVALLVNYFTKNSLPSAT